MARIRSTLVLAAVLAGLVACRSSPAAQTPSAAPSIQAEMPVPASATPVIDVQRTLQRYQRTLAETIALLQQQPWFQDGLSADEEVFVDRLLTYLARSPGSTVGLGRELVPEATIRDKLFLLETVPLQRGPTQVLLVYWPGDDAYQEMRILKTGLPVLERVMRTPFPVPVISFFNGPHPVNMLDDPYFIRIANSNHTSAAILFHESAHVYWHTNVPNWFAEGMADLLAAYVRDEISKDPPDWWQDRVGALERLYQADLRAIASGNFQERPLASRPQLRGEVYIYSLVLLNDIRRLMGDDQFFKAAADLYAQTGGVRLIFGDEITRTFTAYAPPEKRQEIASRIAKELGDE